MYKVFLRFFGRIGIKYYSSYFAPLKEEILKSNLNILFELYVGKMLFISFISFILIFIFVSVAMANMGIALWISIVSGLIASVTTALVVLFLYHSYPYHLLTSRKSSIEGTIPFAINHMAAIASSGVPPFVMFKLLSSVPEYAEITNESRRIVRNVEVFGMDIASAIRNVANRTPSEAFRQFLSGIVATIETGGDIKKFLEHEAEDALFEYRLRREKYTQTLSTYADFYTAVLIAAPLFFVSILSIMSLIGGEVLGMSIPVAMQLGIYVLIPLLNTIFLVFISYTQPSM